MIQVRGNGQLKLVVMPTPTEDPKSWTWPKTWFGEEWWWEHPEDERLELKWVLQAVTTCSLDDCLAVREIWRCTGISRMKAPAGRASRSPPATGGASASSEPVHDVLVMPDGSTERVTRAAKRYRV